ncbi:MAG TPA: enoyl-CoA hydratase/isomerase family protein, partial [Dehalococcoidia bacterium]|nr:enoyl-CoA hydratase/isomerase family protein [Dehalococcoidia bacterium]
LIGWSKALDMMVTGRTVTPQEALQLGILDRLLPAERLAEETRAYAEALARGALRAIGNIKLAVRQGLERDLDYGLRLEQELIEELFRSMDGQEGIRAFLERRPPQFKGL